MELWVKLGELCSRAREFVRQRQGLLSTTPATPADTGANPPIEDRSPFPFKGAHLTWPFDRQKSPLDVRIVEPRTLSPQEHGELFNRIISELIDPTNTLVDRFSAGSQIASRGFDLATFPEAFVPIEVLITALEALVGTGPSGCFHVGLRPSSDRSNHLFSVDQIRGLVDRLVSLSARVKDDLSIFRDWLSRQNAGHFFNIACVFAVDANGDMRICLHPKLVRSQFESQPLPEKHMHEADLLTLITLQPTRKEFPTVTLQPLICSDVLNLPTDRPTGPPMAAVAQYAGCFGASPPDHVDIVSVATCTPQTVIGPGARTWHEQFRSAFVSAARDPQYSRHHFAAIILANFQEIDSNSGAGLSGAFLPIPPYFPETPSETLVFCWGQPSDGSSRDNQWSLPGDDAVNKWRSLGFIAALDPFNSRDGAVARIFCFAIQRLPRETSLWGNAGVRRITEARVLTCIRQGGELIMDNGSLPHER